jgi:hypothetical protein
MFQVQAANARVKAANLAQSRAKVCGCCCPPRLLLVVLLKTNILFCDLRQRASQRAADDGQEEGPSSDVQFNCTCGLSGKNVIEDDMCATCSRCKVRFHVFCANYSYDTEDDIPANILVTPRPLSILIILPPHLSLSYISVKDAKLQPPTRRLLSSSLGWQCNVSCWVKRIITRQIATLATKQMRYRFQFVISLVPIFNLPLNLKFFVFSYLMRI